jgi:thymidylate synthase
MPHLIQTKNCLTAWKEACNYISSNGNGFNLFIHINEPLNFNVSDFKEILNAGIISNTQLQDVINTIFPYKLFNRNSNRPIEDFYNIHEEIYYRGKKMHSKNKARWGNYFLRFTRFGDNRENQLQKIIIDINKRPNNQAACYIMHVSSIDYDSNTRVIGNPCLQYVQFAQHNNALHLTAVYRNHDFLKKALGNYIGLSKLLEFVCLQTNSQIGSVTCHSIHYYLEQKKKVKNCIDNLTW